MDTIAVIKVITRLIMPPGCLVIALLVGLCAWRRWPRLAVTLIASSALALYLLSTPLVAGRLANTLEVDPAVDALQVAAFGAEAIVVLGGGRRLHAPEFDGPTVSTHALARLRYAAHLQRTTGLPIAVTGGTVMRPALPEAELMAKVLKEDFQQPVRWVETASRNTAQNATGIRALLQPEGIRRVVVLSHATHLPRAVQMFRDQGFEVLPAPTAFIGDPDPGSVLIGDLLPSAEALLHTRLALHEHLGLLWYRLRTARE